MRSTDGIDLLIDQSLPNFWDVNHDIAVISGPNAVPITERLIALGQHQIVIVTDADVTVDQPVRHIEGPQRLDKPLISTIFTVQSGKSIDDQSLAALKVELPSFTHIPTDTEGTALDTFRSLAQQIRAQYKTVHETKVAYNFCGATSTKLTCNQSDEIGSRYW